MQKESYLIIGYKRLYPTAQPKELSGAFPNIPITKITEILKNYGAELESTEITSVL